MESWKVKTTMILKVTLAESSIQKASLIVGASFND